MNKNIKEQTKTQAFSLSFGEGWGGALTIIILLIAISAKSQLYFQFNSGYAKGINNKKYFDKENSYTNKPYYNLDTTNYSQYNLAQGFFVEPQVGYKITKWLEFSVGFYYNNNYLVNGYGNSFEYEEPPIMITLYEYQTNSTLVNIKQNRFKTKYSSKILGFTPQVSVNKMFGKFGIILSIGAFISNTSVYSISDSVSYNTYGDLIVSNSIDTLIELNRIGYTNISKSNYTYYSKVNVSTQINFSLSYNIDNNIGLYFNVKFTNLVFTPNKRTRTNYYLTKERYFNSIESQNTTTIQSDEEITEDIDGDLFGMNTLQLSFGIRYTFGKTNKSVTAE